MLLLLILPTSNGSTKRPYKVMYTNANYTYHKERYWLYGYGEIEKQQTLTSIKLREKYRVFLSLKEIIPLSYITERSILYLYLKPKPDTL